MALSELRLFFRHTLAKWLGILQFKQFLPYAGHLVDRSLLPGVPWEWLPQPGQGREDRVGLF